MSSVISLRSFSLLSVEYCSSRFEGRSVLVLLIVSITLRITIYCYGGSNSLRTSEYTWPVHCGSFEE